MAKISVSISELAVRDIEEIRSWYQEELVPEVGQRIAAGIMTRIEALKDHPDMGRMVPEFDYKYLRELVYPPFRIVYKREGKRVRVVRIWRSERLLKLAPDA